MANSQVPTSLRIDEVTSGSALISWKIPDPLQSDQLKYLIYTSTTADSQFHGPAYETTLQKLSVPSPISGEYYVVVSSFNIVTGQESDQSEPLFITLSGDSSLVAIKNSAFGPVVTSSISSSGSGTVTVPTGHIFQTLLGLEVRVNTTPNNYNISIYKDSGRTKLIYKVTGITDQQYITMESLAMYLVDSSMYFTVDNNSAGSRIFTLEGNIEVRD